MKWDDTLFCGDNLEILREYIPDECVDLAYIDPPFFSNRDYAIIWGDEAERRSFEDTWEGGIESYIAWMDPRLRELRRVLKEDGSIYVHCDWHASHRLRRLLDDIMGAVNFQNEIIWYYRGGGVSKHRFARRHDNIYFYSKTSKSRFYPDMVRTPYSEDSQDRLKYKARAFRGNKVYDTYKPHPEGKHPDDVWIIQPIMPSAKERLGYPTQKPEKLLAKIINASSREDDLVLDCFCGCGTTLAVAHRLNRRWIGVDISYTAIELVKERLAKLGVTKPQEVGMPTTVEDALRLQPFDFQTWMLKRLHAYASPKKTGDLGIDGFTYFKQHPIQIKKVEHIGRNVIDNFHAAMVRLSKAKGYIIGISFTKGALAEISRLKVEEGLVIVPVTLDEVMKDYRIEE
ncbi:MAG TPA: site-specific DNA-methyltransferase [Anaerolineales bacterium]|nr:site-specific DNA-methyltransferase [Anaerolineales bacterium]